MRTLTAVVMAMAAAALSHVARGADYYLANKPGSGSGTKDDPFGLADLPRPDNKPTRPLAVLQPGDTLWFKGGEYALHTGPVKDYYAVGYLRPARSGETGKPISFCACPGERVVLTAASGGQPIFGNLDRDYVRHEGFVVKGTIGHVGGKGAEIAYCEIIGQYVDTADNHDGIRVEHADGAWIHHNIIHGVQGKSGNSVGIKIYKSENLVVEDNYIYDNTRGIFDKDSGINNTYRRNFLTQNRLEQFHGNNQGKYMVARIYDNVIDGHVALGYLVDGTEVHDNLIRGDMLAGHWAGELWNTHLWNNIVLARGKAVTAYNESKNPFVITGEKKHLAYMDYNLYTAPPKYTFGAYAQGRGEAFGMDEMRSRGFERHSQVVAGAGEIFKDEQSWELLPKWKTAGRDGGAVGPENVAAVLDLRRYGPAAGRLKVIAGPSENGSAQGIEAAQVGAKTIRVTSPGRFETDITTVKGFGHTFFDLAHDPQKKRDLAPVFEEAGLLWTKTGMIDPSYGVPPIPSGVIAMSPTSPLRVISGAIVSLCCAPLMAQQPALAVPAQPPVRTPALAGAGIGRPPATGVLVHEDWSGFATVADLYPKGRHPHAALGPSPMQFRIEGMEKYLPAGWNPPRVFNKMLHLGPDPSGVFPRVLGIRLQPGVNFTWGKDGQGSGVTPYVGFRLATAEVNYPKLWVRTYWRLHPGWIQGPQTAPQGGAQKFVAVENLTGGRMGVWATSGGPSVQAEALFTAPSVVVRASRTRWTPLPGDKNWDPFFDESLTGAWRSGPSFDGDFPNDGSWHELVLLMWLEENDTRAKWGVYWRRAHGGPNKVKCLLRQKAVDPPNAFGNVDETTAAAGWIYLCGEKKARQGTFPRPSRLWLLQNRNLRVDSPANWDYGPVTIVDGTVNRNPFGIPASILPPGVAKENRD